MLYEHICAVGEQKFSFSNSYQEQNKALSTLDFPPNTADKYDYTQCPLDTCITAAML